ncbi:MAG: transposase [Nitrosomonas sp.]|nr:transposase [Nitrosomonas sp.]MBP9871125.1 transposase [Nitrosomonas sp.]
MRPEIKRKYFWGDKLWIQSYFVEIIGNANKEVIRQYVQNQLKVMDEMERRFGQLPLF